MKVRSTGRGYYCMYIPFLDIPVHSGWYLFTGFLHVEEARTYSNKYCSPNDVGT